MSVFEGSRLLRGQPGSKVVLTVIRGNAADPHEITLVREKPAVQAVTGKMIGDRRRLHAHRLLPDQESTTELNKQVGDL